MILVTVGTHVQKFDRLVKAVNGLAEIHDEEIVLQRGTSELVSDKVEGFAYTTGEHMEELTKRARVVISQASSGAVPTAFKYNKPVIVVPRLKKYNEHFNDHQIQLAEALEESGRVILIHEPTPQSLMAALNNIDSIKILGDQSAPLVAYLRDYFSSL